MAQCGDSQTGGHGKLHLPVCTPQKRQHLLSVQTGWAQFFPENVFL